MKNVRMLLVAFAIAMLFAVTVFSATTHVAHAAATQTSISGTKSSLHSATSCVISSSFSYYPHGIVMTRADGLSYVVAVQQIQYTFQPIGYLYSWVRLPGQKNYTPFLNSSVGSIVSVRINDFYVGMSVITNGPVITFNSCEWYIQFL